MQRLGGVLTKKLRVPLNICVLMAYRVRFPGAGKVGRDVLPCYRLPLFVHHEHVDRVATPALVFGHVRSPVRVLGGVCAGRC